MPFADLSPAELRLETDRDAAAIDALVDRAFGPGRYTKVSERVRERASQRRDLSFCAWAEGRIVGTVRIWAVSVSGRPALFLGPIAVDSAARRGGLGAALVRRTLEAGAGVADAMILVGDSGFFAPLGFSAAPAAKIVLPAPVDQARVLLAPLTPGGETGWAGPLT